MRDPPENLSQQAHRRLIGLLGLLLPLLLYFLAGMRRTAALPPWNVLDSVSAYYHTGSVGVFVGVLFALALFLASYQGYQGVRADRILGGIAGVAALGVALFPTDAPSGVVAPEWWEPWMGKLHYASAIILFLSFILFALWLFRKSDVAKREDRPPDKRLRDDVCLVCGIVMIIAVSWAGIMGLRDRPIWLPESIAIVAFAVSWLTKGEAHEPLVKALQRLRT